MEGWLEKRSREGWTPQYVRVDADHLTAHDSADRGAKAIVVVELAAARVIGSAEAAQASKPFTVLPVGVATKDDSGALTLRCFDAAADTAARARWLAALRAPRQRAAEGRAAASSTTSSLPSFGEFPDRNSDFQQGVELRSVGQAETGNPLFSLAPSTTKSRLDADAGDATAAHVPCQPPFASMKETRGANGAPRGGLSMRHVVAGVVALVLLALIVPAALAGRYRYAGRSRGDWRPMRFVSSIVLANITAAEVGTAERGVLQAALKATIVVDDATCEAVNVTGVAVDTVLYTRRRRALLSDGGKTADNACMDADQNAADVDGVGCDSYRSGGCGRYDDEDFSSNAMCCVCGGGSSDVVVTFVVDLVAPDFVGPSEVRALASRPDSSHICNSRHP